MGVILPKKQAHITYVRQCLGDWICATGNTRTGYCMSQFTQKESLKYIVHIFCFIIPLFTTSVSVTAFKRYEITPQIRFHFQRLVFDFSTQLLYKCCTWFKTIKRDNSETLGAERFQLHVKSVEL